MKRIIDTHDIVLMTLDTLRYDIAAQCMKDGRTPNFKQLFPEGWQKRHSPGNFTYPAHHAIFSGFLPTPADAEANHERLFAAEFAGSETTGENTFVFSGSNWIGPLAQRGYHTICIGGVGFFNQQSAISRVFPNLFEEAHWSDAMGVTSPNSAQIQFELAAEKLTSADPDQRVLLFINVSAIHQPNCHYLDSSSDTLNSHAAALEYVDSQLPILLGSLTKRTRPVFVIICSDHGTLYGEDGFTGHRVGHEHIYTVPYAETFL